MSDNLKPQVIRGLGDWNDHYDDPNGYAKVEARAAMYDLVGEGVPRIDWDQKIIETIGYLGFSDEIEMADIGCSYPHLLIKLVEAGFRGLNGGPLYGIEPNTGQIGGLSYWEPSERGVPLKGLDYARRAQGKSLKGIQLIKAPAEELPFADRRLNVVTAARSLYAIKKSKQPKAFDELGRVITEDGKLIATLTGRENKAGTHVKEPKMADCLSVIMGQTIIPPEPVNSGFTSEDAREVLTARFDYVSVFHRETPLIISDMRRLEVVLNSYRSLMDMYTDEDGNRGVVDPVHFETALHQVVVSEVMNSANRGRFVIDKAVQDLLVASNARLRLPEEKGYQVLKAA